MELVQDTLTSLLTVQGKTFCIPSFQRPYKWDKDQWNDLFIDIKRAYEKKTEHFMGAVVMQQSNDAEDSKYTIIDGQQRLTTISLCLLALAKWIKDYNSGNTYLYNTTIKSYLITNNFDGSEEKRLVLSNKQDNNAFYSDLIDEFYSNNKVTSKRNIFTKVTDYFYNEINTYYHDENDGLEINEFVNRFFSTISQKLKFIMIKLGSSEDANMIFETLNTRGKPLVPGELIRNYIFMHPKIRNAEGLYSKFWEPIEKYFEELEADKIANFSEFIKSFVYANKDDTRVLKNSNNQIYLEVKDFMNDYLKDYEINDLMEKLMEYKDYYHYIVHPTTLPNSYPQKIVVCLSLMLHLKVYVYIPIFLKLFHQQKSNLISMHTLESIITLITSYSIRLTLHGRKKPNKMIPEIIYVITNFTDERSISEEVEKIIHRQTSSPFYTDEEFIKMIEENSIYSSRNTNFTKYLLLTLFNYDTQNKLSYTTIDGLTLEHIFPQNDQQWINDLDEDELEQNRKLVNTLGNLTLVNQKLNSKMSNGSFSQKKKELQKYSIWYFEREKYFINNVEKWSGNAISERSRHLGQILIKLLQGPNHHLMSNAKNKADLAIKINEEIIKERKQKDTYIKTIKKIHDMTDHITWNRLNIKGCAASDRSRFTAHQRNHLTKIGDIYINYHASLLEKKQRLLKIAKFCNVKIELQ